MSMSLVQGGVDPALSAHILSLSEGESHVGFGFAFKFTFEKMLIYLKDLGFRPASSP